MFKTLYAILDRNASSHAFGNERFVEQALVQRPFDKSISKVCKKKKLSLPWLGAENSGKTVRELHALRLISSYLFRFSCFPFYCFRGLPRSPKERKLRNWEKNSLRITTRTTVIMSLPDTWNMKKTLCGFHAIQSSGRNKLFQYSG